MPDFSSSTKRSAQAPVKLACLACRASRIRCDGKSVCTSCSRKNRICSYAKSRRGGPRVSRKKSLAVQSERGTHVCDTSRPVVASADEDADPIPQSHPAFDDLVMPMISPGAGLKRLDDDLIFDSIFGSSSSDDNEVMLTLDRIDSHSEASPPAPKVRGYACDADILNAYYTFGKSMSTA